MKTKQKIIRTRTSRNIKKSCSYCINCLEHLRLNDGIKYDLCDITEELIPSWAKNSVICEHFESIEDL